MRILLAAVLAVILSVSIFLPSAAQQTVSTSLQPLQLLRSALSALTPTTAASDVTLSGTAHYIAGSDDEIGSATLKATATGASRIDLDLPSGVLSELRNTTTDPPTGTWSGPDRVSHTIVNHNLFIEPVWFFPAITIARLTGPGYLATYVGSETVDSLTFQHVSVNRQPADPAIASPLAAHLSQTELYLDPSTFLPAAIAFNVHPDDDAGLDLPMEILFSDYRVVNGTKIPFRIQRYLNNTLTLDIQIQTAVMNSGLSSTTLGSL
jgi:hypothetical protein